MASERKKSKKEVQFSWTADKLQLLLQAALDYNGKCQFNAEIWEIKRQNYEDIFDILMKEYPDEKEKYPNEEKRTRSELLQKLKAYDLGLKKQLIAVKKVVEVM